MPLYESRQKSENKIVVDTKWRDAVVIGPETVITEIVRVFQEKAAKEKRAITAAFEGWYGIDWAAILDALSKSCTAAGIAVEAHSVNEVFKSIEEIEEYKKAFTVTDDPGFGIVNTEGTIQDLTVPAKVASLADTLKQAKQTGAGKVVVVYGAGCALAELLKQYDLCFYFDKTRQPILWEMWDGKLTPFGYSEPKKDYFWKEYYYCDYYLLDRQKELVMEHMDFWLEAIYFKDLKLIPRQAYDGIMQTLVRYPVKEVPIYQPGPWGAYRYKDLFDVPGLECNAWNELAGPELSILVDIGLAQMINMPMTNLMQYNDLFLGKFINKTYPHLFPMDVWLDDGYFPKPTPPERTSMPMHNHPSTDYVKQHFKEPLGRYETYYIAEAYEGANTWFGYRDDADLEEWERKCRASNNLTEIPDWKDFIQNWDTNVGDLFLITPGTCHGHGGNQMVLEMDTCPSVAATEYSFFLYDFARPSWDDNKKTMTGKPVKMHLDHGFDNEKWVRASWAENRLRAKPIVIKWTKEYQLDRYTSDPRMPFEIERLHFEKRGEYDTQGKFMHIATLTVGNKVTVRSKKHPELTNVVHKWQSVLIPACFGEYEFINEGEGMCTIVYLRWKLG